MNDKQLAFVIAYERPDGGLASYSFGREVINDTLKSAKEYQEYANAQYKDKKFNIYGLVKIDLDL